MAMTRELSLHDASHEALPLPAPSLVRGEDAATYDQLAAALNGIDNRRVAERLRAAALAAERTAAPSIEDGEFALVPDGEPA